ncbi:tRNA lysidine(34) synthetase TilS [Undibacterium jejuense]|uniref:tRNA(Ile)-lysidine synthase n=1 Tax=Undibacterium jejuense TaxID=1344949 RepID=A0A923HGI0_9BURK|nr:tRNA lysidine(34) synthetase TilS [Undibacterium jejuense]MBC3861650.1 tRNA lysidine(34) synthetase TilS [Undibacterium jejuense]
MTLRSLSGALMHHFSEALNSIFLESGKAPPECGLAVAYSGGLDSSVLLSLTAEYCRLRGIPLDAFHVHHGLSPNADDWLVHCESNCQKLGISLAFEKIVVTNNEGDGIEGSARKGRYLALGRMSVASKTQILLSAHHQDDQAETLLMQMLRGSGVAGLSGMNRFNFAPGLFGTPSVMMMRPLLDVSRLELEHFARENQISYIQDESNEDGRYLRNALRLQVMPVLEQISPGFAGRMLRTAKHMQSAQNLAEALAGQDLAHCLSGQMLDLDLQRMRTLSAERINNLFRLWLSKFDVRMPSTSRLNEICKQLFEAKGDARITIYHEKLAIHRYQEKIYAADRAREAVDDALSVAFTWNGESSMPFPDFHGTLHFRRGSRGLSPDWLQQQALCLHLRRGGERLKLAENRSTRDMKSHYQALRIPFWVRQQLPFVSIGSELVYAAGVGMQSQYCSESVNTQVGTHLVLDWVAD